MTLSLFHLDLVIVIGLGNKTKWRAHNNTVLFTNFLATRTYWLQFHSPPIGRRNQLCESVFLLLFRKNSNWKLCDDGWLFIRIELARAASSPAEIFYYNDCECTKTTFLSWIQKCQHEIGNIWLGKSNVIKVKPLYSSIYSFCFFRSRCWGRSLLGTRCSKRLIQLNN